jgi:tRNA G46 methylase TrmB
MLFIKDNFDNSLAKEKRNIIKETLENIRIFKSDIKPVNEVFRSKQMFLNEFRSNP